MLSRAQLCDPMNHSTPGLPVHHQLLEFTHTSIESVMPPSHLILCHPLLLLPPIPPSIRVFSNESTLCVRWPKYWSFSISIIPSKEHPGLNRRLKNKKKKNNKNLKNDKSKNISGTFSAVVVDSVGSVHYQIVP